MDTFKDIIRLWPSYAAAAKAIGVSRETIKSWAKRNSIPATHYLHVTRAAPQITLEQLVRMRSAQLPPDDQEAA